MLRCWQFSQCQAFCKEQNWDILNVPFLERSILPYLKDPSIPKRSEWVFFPPGLFSSSVLYNSALIQNVTLLYTPKDTWQTNLSGWQPPSPSTRWSQQGTHLYHHTHLAEPEKGTSLYIHTTCTSTSRFPQNVVLWAHKILSLCQESHITKLSLQLLLAK